MRKGSKAEKQVAALLSGRRDALSGAGGRLDVYTDEWEIEVKEVGHSARGIYLSRKLLDKVQTRAHLRGKRGAIVIVERNLPPSGDRLWIVVPLHSRGVLDVQRSASQQYSEEERETRRVLWRQIHAMAKELFGSHPMRDGDEVVPAYIYFTRFYARKRFGVPSRRYLTTPQLLEVRDWLREELRR